MQVGSCKGSRETFEKHNPHNKDDEYSKPPSTKRRKTEEESTPQPDVKSCLDLGLTDNLFDGPYKEDNLEPMEKVAKLIKEKKFDEIEIINLKHFIKDAVFKGNGEKLDFLVKGFEEYSKEWKIVHPSMLFLQKGVDCSSSKGVTLMQQCLAVVSSKEVCARLLKWVSKRNLIRYLLKPTEQEQNMLIIDITAQNRVDILNLLFEEIDDLNILEEEEKLLREQVSKREIPPAALDRLYYHLYLE